MNVLKEFKGIFEVDKAFYETFKECISKDATRSFLMGVYFDSENNTFVATSGRRLIKHTPTETYNIESGYYELAKIGKVYKMIPKDMEGRFPNYQKILLNIDSNYKVLRNDKKESMFSIQGNMKHDSWLLSEIVLQNETPINFDFITKVLKHVPEFEVMIADTHEGGNHFDPIYFIIDQCTTYMAQPMSR